ncbi:MAG: hypothetical protein F7C81_02730 [Desulfurococcales archaeon]|nr:hypothetical protein [Desulfurococcales archaeon]
MTSTNQEERRGKPWWSLVDPGKLDQELRRRLLERLVRKHGVKATSDLLGVDRTLVYRMRKGRVAVGDHHISKILSGLSMEEFEEELTLGEKLEALGIISGERINYTLLLEVLAVALRDPYARSLILRYVTQHYREDLREMLESELEMKRLQWTKGFEEYLRKPHKGKPIIREDTLTYYHNLFKKHLEGRKLSRSLVEEVAESGSQWLRVVFRHYARYLYTRGEISHQTLHWIEIRVPGRRTQRTPRNPVIDYDVLRSTLEFLRESNWKYYVLYRLMLESGLRFEHSLHMLSSPQLDGNVVIYDRVYPRLYCDRERGFCRLYIGFNRGVKRAEFAYTSTQTIGMIKQLGSLKVHRRSVERYAFKHGLVMPGLLRKASWQLLIASGVPREVARFIHSRFGELRISESYYENLVSEADQWYPRYLHHLSEQELI